MLFKAEPHPRAHPGCQRAGTEDAQSGAGKAGRYQPQLQEKQSSASAGSRTARKRAEMEAARPCECSPRHGRVNLHSRTAGRAPEAAKRRPPHAATVGAPRSAARAAGCCAQGSKRASEHAGLLSASREYFGADSSGSVTLGHLFSSVFAGVCWLCSPYRAAGRGKKRISARHRF